MCRAALLFAILGALTVFSGASAEPSDKQSLLERGIAEKNRNEFDAAIADFDRVIALDSGLAAAYEFRGAAFAAKFEASENPPPDLIGKAVADYDAVIRLGAATARTYTLRGIALADRDDHQGAIVDFDKALKLDTKFELATRAKEFSAGQLREQERSIDTVADLLRFQPRNVDLLLTHAGLLGQSGRRDEALRDVGKVLEIDPKNEGALAQKEALTAKP